MTAKNKINLYLRIILFFLCNIALFFGLDFLLKKIPELFFNGAFWVYLRSGIFLIVLLFLNIRFIFPYFKKQVKKFIRKYLLKNKTRTKFTGYLFIGLILSAIFLFQHWNIDFITQQYFSPFNQIFASGRTTSSKVNSRVDYSGVASVNISASSINKTPYSSDYGRFLRTYRWSPFIEKAEKTYGIEKGLLAGLIMQESYGNPLQLNSGGDGGAGLMMFQPGTAREYGLKIYGSSKNTGRDTRHGRALKTLQELHQYNYDKLSVIDERFHVAKSIDAGARFLSRLHQQYHSWDKAVSAYNRGTPALFPQSTAHVRKVRYFQNRYLNYLKTAK